MASKVCNLLEDAILMLYILDLTSFILPVLKTIC